MSRISHSQLIKTNNQIKNLKHNNFHHLNNNQINQTSLSIIESNLLFIHAKMIFYIQFIDANIYEKNYALRTEFQNRKKKSKLMKS